MKKMKSVYVGFVLYLILSSASVLADYLQSSSGVQNPGPGNVVQGVPGYDYGNFTYATVCPIQLDISFGGTLGENSYCQESGSGTRFSSWEIINLGSARTVSSITLDHTCDPSTCPVVWPYHTVGTRIYYTTGNPSSQFSQWVYVGTTSRPNNPAYVYRDIFSFTPRTIRGILIGGEADGSNSREHARLRWHELVVS